MEWLAKCGVSEETGETHAVVVLQRGKLVSEEYDDRNTSHVIDMLFGNGKDNVAGWVDHARTPTPGSDGQYGAHWWLATDGSEIFTASGYRGQYIVVDPSRELVVVRLGGSTPEQRGNVLRGLAALVRGFPKVGVGTGGGGPPA